MSIDPNSVTRSPWLYDVEPFHIVDNLYYVGNSSVSSHLIDTGDGLLLLDTTYPQTGYLLIESIRKLGFDPADIRWILHSHGHIDHFGATRMLVEKYGCKTYMPKADIPFLNEQSQLNWCKELEMPYTPPYDTWFQVDVAVEPGNVLTFGNTTIEVHDGKGHTPGTAIYLFHLPGGLRGITHGGVGINTMASAYCKEHNLGHTWRDNYVASMEYAKTLQAEVLISNHPGQVDLFDILKTRTAEYNPFIDPEAWPKFIDKRMALYRKDIEIADPM